jgi:hypothetical protein
MFLTSGSLLLERLAEKESSGRKTKNEIPGKEAGPTNSRRHRDAVCDAELSRDTRFSLRSSPQGVGSSL